MATVCISCESPVPDDAAFCPICGVATPTGTSEPRSTALPVEVQLEQLQRAFGDRYRVERVLGQGGMATVYLAEDLRHRRKVAVKVLRPALAALLGPERFLREIAITGRLQHPHILTLIDSGEADGLLYYVMPFVEGESLRQRLTREPQLSIGEVVHILRDVADALAYAHGHGIVHRDIKPDNVLLTERHALVVDFGVAKAACEATGPEGLTAPGLWIGTPAYMAPEQMEDGRAVDHRADIYAVGALAYELLSGTRLEVGETPRSVDALRPRVPRALVQIVMRCLAKQPADRWQRADELLAQIEELTTRTLWSIRATPAAGFVKPTLPWRRPLGPLIIDACRAGLRRVKPVERWQAMALALLALLVFAVLFARPELRLAYHMVRSRVASWQTRPPAAASPNTDNPVEGWERSLGAGWLPVVWIGDSAVAVVGPSTLDVYGARGWRSVPLPHEGSRFLPATVANELWVFGRSEELTRTAYTRVSKLQDGELRPGDSLPFLVSAVWSGGSVVVVGGGRGESALYERGAWTQLPSGRTVGVARLFGVSRDDLYAHGGHALCGRRLDSLLHFDGFAWRALDPRPDESVEWSYNAGTTLADGTVVVVGETCPPVRPLILSRRAETSAWEAIDVGLPDSLLLRGVWGNSLDDFAVWGSPCFPPKTYCFYQVTAGEATPVVELGDRRVFGVGRIGGRLHVLASDGALWSRPRQTWGIVAAAPASGWGVPEAWVVPSSLASTWNALIRPLRMASNDRRFFAPRSSSMVSPGFLVIVAVLDSVSRLFVSRYEGGALVPHEWTPSADERLADLTVSPGGEVLAVGERGLVVTLRGNAWNSQTITGENLGAVAVLQHVGSAAEPEANRAAPVVAAGDHTLFLRTPADRWTEWGSMPPGLGLVTHVAAVVDPEEDDTLVVVVGTASWTTLRRGSAALRRRTWFESRGGGRHVNSNSLTDVTAVLALPDGRLVVGTGPQDPLRGGELFLWPWPDDVAQRVPLPTGIDVVDLAFVRGTLQVRGSGWYRRTILLRDLFAAEVGRN